MGQRQVLTLLALPPHKHLWEPFISTLRLSAQLSHRICKDTHKVSRFPLRLSAIVQECLENGLRLFFSGSIQKVFKLQLHTRLFIKNGRGHNSLIQQW